MGGKLLLGAMQNLPKLRHVTIKSVIRTMLDEVLEGCSRDCERILYCGSRSREDSRERLRSNYWDRFSIPETRKEDDDAKGSGGLIISEHTKSCRLGFQVSSDQVCPIADCDVEEGSEEEMVMALEVVAAVVQKRVALRRDPYGG
jgi:hypothetical protein